MNQNIITAKPIILNSDQTFGENFTTTDNAVNYTQNSAQDWTNQFSKSEVIPNYQTTENNTYQVYQTQIPTTTTQNINQIEGIQIDQNYFQSTPIETTTSNYIQGTPIETTSTSNFIQSTPIETTTSNYISGVPIEQTTTNVIQNTQITTENPVFQSTPITTTNVTQNIPTLSTTNNMVYQSTPYTMISNSPRPINNIIQTTPVTTTTTTTTTTNVIPQTNQVVTQTVAQPSVQTTQPVQVQAQPTIQANPQTSNNSHFVNNYPIFENDPRRVAFYNNKVKVYNTYRLVKPVPIEN
jgi:hypothetical protein